MEKVPAMVQGEQGAGQSPTQVSDGVRAAKETRGLSLDLLRGGSVVEHRQGVQLEERSYGVPRCIV